MQRNPPSSAHNVGSNLPYHTITPGLIACGTNDVDKQCVTISVQALLSAARPITSVLSRQCSLPQLSDDFDDTSSEIFRDIRNFVELSNENEQNWQHDGILLFFFLILLF